MLLRKKISKEKREKVSDKEVGVYEKEDNYYSCFSSDYCIN